MSHSVKSLSSFHRDLFLAKITILSQKEMNILCFLAIMLFALPASSAGHQQNLYIRMGLLNTIVSSQITENLSAKSKIECGALCSIKAMGQCNSFVYSKKEQSCQPAKLDLNPGNASNPYPDIESYVNQGKCNFTHGMLCFLHVQWIIGL